MNDYLAVYIERYVTYRIDNEDIMQQFQNMKYREKQLSNFIYFSFLFFIFCFLLCWYIQVLFCLKFYIIYVSY